MSKTKKNLEAAFAGESQANRRYLAFAKKADEEGHTQVAKLFRAVAEAETIHAHSHLDVLEGVGSTADNLKEAISGENYEHVSMYPEFIETAKEEVAPKALKSFRWAMAVEVIHEELYKSALEDLAEGGEVYEYYICPRCGHTHARSAPDKCPICGTPGSEYFKVN
ncbi:MAG: rubrerythrin family protein [Anaerolineaceae bacterium]|nr:rubrerythrin family protein [Anaerolineaceae bacterium]